LLLAHFQLVPLRCGVRGVWVHPGHRRRGIASTLLSAARHGLVSGYVVGLYQLKSVDP
jgi:predicted GNAT family acetyltransferase